MRLASLALISTILSAASVRAQQVVTPRFENYPVTESFKGAPADPILTATEERRYRTVIRQGVSKGYGVEGPDGNHRPGPNFAGHYFIITWGCGFPCLMAAIVDAKTGRIFPPPFHGPGHSYFQVPWNFPGTPLDYRLNSRLLITNICETNKVVHIGSQVSYVSDKCGPHYFVMGEDGLRLVHRLLEKDR